MFRNRIAAEGVPVRPPRPPDPPPAPAGFMLCPACLMNAAQWACQQQLYLWAFQQAQAVVRPSLPERDLLGVWN